MVFHAFLRGVPDWGVLCSSLCLTFMPIVPLCVDLLRLVVYPDACLGKVQNGGLLLPPYSIGGASSAFPLLPFPPRDSWYAMIFRARASWPLFFTGCGSPLSKTRFLFLWILLSDCLHCLHFPLVLLMFPCQKTGILTFFSYFYNESILYLLICVKYLI